LKFELKKRILTFVIKLVMPNYLNMKKLTLILIVALVAVTTVITSCKKSGCTDPAAGNYDSEAENDNGLCCYNRDVLVFEQTVVMDEFATSDDLGKFIIDQVRVESCSAEDKTQIKCWVINVAPDTATFDFKIELMESITTAVWECQGDVVLLPPGDTLYVGVISTNATDIEGKEIKVSNWEYSYHK